MPVKLLILIENAEKNLTRLPAFIQKKIIHKLDLLEKNPLLGIKLHGEFSGYYKLIVGDYRIVYRFDSKSKTVIVVKIEHRQGVYR